MFKRYFGILITSSKMHAVVVIAVVRIVIVIAVVTVVVVVVVVVVIVVLIIVAIYCFRISVSAVRTCLNLKCQNVRTELLPFPEHINTGGKREKPP